MSGTTTPNAPIPPQPRSGKIAISIIQQATFIAALLLTGWLAWSKQDQIWITTFAGLVGIAASNATHVVGYWIGGSADSDHKTDIIAQSPPIVPPSPDKGSTP
jgi:hypothetical protein